MGELTQVQVDEIVETAKFLTGTTCDSDRAQALIFLSEANRELTRQVEQLQAMEKALIATIRWAERRCPCNNDEPKQCPLCDARVDDIGIGGVCKAVPITFPPSLLRELRLALPLNRALTAPPSSSDPGRNDSKGIEGDTGREEK